MFYSGRDSSTSVCRDVLSSLNIFNFRCCLEEGMRPRQRVEVVFLEGEGSNVVGEYLNITGVFFRQFDDVKVWNWRGLN